MTKEEIAKLAEHYVKAYQDGFDDFQKLLVLAMEEVERETRHRFFAHIQAANNAACHRDNVKDILDRNT